MLGLQISMFNKSLRVNEFQQHILGKLDREIRANTIFNHKATKFKAQPEARFTRSQIIPNPNLNNEMHENISPSLHKQFLNSWLYYLNFLPQILNVLFTFPMLHNELHCNSLIPVTKTIKTQNFNNFSEDATDFEEIPVPCTSASPCIPSQMNLPQQARSRGSFRCPFFKSTSTQRHEI